MKERVVNMPTDERKACAERVVRAFWTAMGGDSAELSDLDDNSDWIDSRQSISVSHRSYVFDNLLVFLSWNETVKLVP